MEELTAPDPGRVSLPPRSDLEMGDEAEEREEHVARSQTVGSVSQSEVSGEKQMAGRQRRNRGL